jgi:hypothetical protein
MWLYRLRKKGALGRRKLVRNSDWPLSHQIDREANSDMA